MQTDDDIAMHEECDERSNISAKKTNKLVLKDLPSEAHQEFLQLYFEHTRLGGHTVSGVEVDNELAIALVEFSTSEAVDDILRRAPITISGQQVRVKPYFEAEEVQELCTVKVEGLHGVDKETIEMYFESEKRSGGDDIETTKLDEDGTTAYITFKSEEVTRRVVERGNHTLHGNQLEVTLWQPPKQSWNVPSPEPEKKETEPMPANMIQIYGVDDTINEQMLELYFENTKRSGGDDITDLKIHENIVYITYKSEEVAQRVVERGQHTLNSLELIVSLCEHTRDGTTTREPNDLEEPVCTIEVTGIDESMDKETLALYFENTKRSGGDLIQDLYIDYDDRKVLITYQDSTVAQRVADRKYHSLCKKNLQVKLIRRSDGSPDTETMPKRLCEIKVQGVGPSIEEDTLIMYFENKKRSGGDTVVKTNLDKSTETAYIEFESEEVAKRVAARDSHVLNKKPLKVSIHIPNKPGKEEQQETSVVKVKGLTKIRSHDALRYYFENQRRSGGGDITDVTYHDEDADLVFLTFCDPQIAVNVASRNHEVEGQSLQVSLHIPPKPRPFYKDKILIKGLQSTTTRDCLFNFLEAKLKTVPVELQTGEEEGVVLVTFDDQPNVEKLSKICAKLPLEGAMLQVSRVQVSNCIIVFNIPDNASKDAIQFYFENTRKSDGGQVDKVVMNEEECYCLVYFVNYSVVDKVLDKRHLIGGNVLMVKLYFDCLGCSIGDVIGAPLKLPGAFVIHDVEPSKLKFMRQSQTTCDAIIHQMNDVNADIKLPNQDSKTNDIWINCTLTRQTADVRKLVKSWQETVSQNFENFMRNIVVAKHDGIQELWNPIMEKMKFLQSMNSDAAVLLADREEGIISVVGLKQVVEIISKIISSCIKEVEDETEMEKKKVKETLTSLKLIETKMLHAQNFPREMEAKFPSLKININQNMNEISFEGPACNITAAKLEMFETKEKYEKASIDMTGCRSFFSLYETEQAKNYIVKRLTDNHVTDVWDIKGKTLTVCSTCEESAEKSLELVKKCIVENRISLSSENLAVLKTDSWQIMLDEQIQKYPGKIEFEAQQKVAYVCSTDDIADEVLDAVKGYLRKNTITEEEIDFGLTINRLIQIDYEDEMANIGKKYDSLKTQIDYKESYSGFILRGTKDGVDDLKKELHILKDRVKNTLPTIEKSGSYRDKAEPAKEENEVQEEEKKKQATSVIKVKGLTRIKSFDTIRYYFENPRRAGGGEIVDITYHEDDDDTVFITYSDPKIAENVASRNHEVEDQSLLVNLYVPPELRPVYKDKILIKGLQSTTTRDSLFNFLEAKSGFVPVELQTGEKEGVVLVRFNDQPDFEKLKKMCAKLPLEGATLQVFQVQVSNCIIVLNIPKNTSKDTICFYFENTRRSNGGLVDKVVMKEDGCYCLVYFVDYSVVGKVLDKEHVFGANVVTVELYHECLGWPTDNVKQTPPKPQNPDAAALLADKEQGIISVAGLKQTVGIASRDISDYFKQVEHETEKGKQKVKEMLTTLKLIEAKMLLAQKFPSKMEAKYPSLKLKINQNKNEISFDGPAIDINAAKIEMFETKEKYAKASVDMSGCRSFFSLYETKQAKDYIVKKLKNNHVTAVWEVNDQTLTVCSTCEENARKSLELIKNCVAENRIGLTVENLALLRTENWQTMLDEQKQKYPGKVEIEAQEKVAYVCSTDDIVDEVVGTVKRCLRKNTIIEDEIDFGKNINRLIEKDHKDEIANITKKYASLNAHINFKRNNAGFTLRGTAEGLDEIKKELNIIKGRVKNKHHTIERPGIASHMKSSKGKEHINTVEEKHHVVIDSTDSDDEEPFHQNASSASKGFSTIGPRIHAECIAYDVKKIYTAEGDMTELPVDVLVSTTDSRLSLNGGLSRAISLKGGIEIRNACQRYIRDKGELGEGEAFLSPAGNLTAKYIVHIVGPTWKGGANCEEAVLDESVLKSMKKASDKNVKSVALPAISCGVYSFPVKRATRIIAQAVKNFFRNVQDSTITDVYLCDVKSNTVECFTDALVEVFGDRNVTKLLTKSIFKKVK